VIDIPSEIRIKSTLRAGSVYYFAEESFTTDEPHYFILISRHSDSDTIILLVCSSSQIAKVKNRRRHLPPETLVEIDPSQYSAFTKNSIIDCNQVFEKSIDEIIQKLEQSVLKMKTEMDISLVEKLRKAVLESPLIEQRIKNLVK